jgi:hypothetical protein
MKRIILTRESVSMGDDAFDHTLEIEISQDWNISQILESIVKMNYLPKIQNGQATWSLSYNKPLAILAQQWNEPKIICNADFPYPNSTKYINIEKLHFNYHAQLDPSTVYTVLREFKTIA